MERDLVQVIDGWDYDPKDLGKNVRRIRGIDGRDKLQMRTELGLSQMELEGRPDGKRPAGFPSVLDWVRHRMEEHRKKGLSLAVFRLSEADVERLHWESLQYQLRVTCWLALGDHAGVSRDVEHNLAAAEILSCHAPDERTRAQFRQLLPPLILERTRAKVFLHASRGEVAGAAREIEQAIRRIVEQCRQADEEGVRSSPSLVVLQEMAEEVHRRFLAGKG